MVPNGGRCRQTTVLRADWAERLLEEGKTAAWFRDNIVWVDICSKVIPGTPSKALDQQQDAL